jgi:hypothetical protein
MDTAPARPVIDVAESNTFTTLNIFNAGALPARDRPLPRMDTPPGKREKPSAELDAERAAARAATAPGDTSEFPGVLAAVSIATAIATAPGATVCDTALPASVKVSTGMVTGVEALGAMKNDGGAGYITGG